jgi:hypothetical protein
MAPLPHNLRTTFDRNPAPGGVAAAERPALAPTAAFPWPGRRPSRSLPALGPGFFTFLDSPEQP